MLTTGKSATAVAALLVVAAGCGEPVREDPAPNRTFAVGIRRLDLSRSAARPLPTLVWYPATGLPGTATASQAPVAAGSFPLLLFSHGLTGKPENYASLLIRIAAAGFVVAAPAYPHTSGGAAEFDALDVTNQPADAFFVIGEVLRLGDHPGDLFAGRLRTRVAAAGHSAGGFTTAGMLARPGDVPVTAAIIIAGGATADAAEPGSETLFIHGDSDQTVPYSAGQSGYQRMRPPKGFLTVVGGDHTRFLGPGHPAFESVQMTMTDFLRATLYRDTAARQRLPADGSSSTTRFKSVSG
jgi:dienelactone hydrolase